MKLTETILVTACMEDYTISQDDKDIYLDPADALALALSLAKWATNPHSRANQGGGELRAVVDTLTAEANYRDARAIKDALLGGT